ncbi:MAG TPA: hypothetical protein PLA68_07455 [Panacibacter sp.]|nr:hypothetical protein [Panacibacter sp.]
MVLTNYEIVELPDNPINKSSGLQIVIYSSSVMDKPAQLRAAV